METNRSTKYLTVTLVHKEYISIFNIYMPSANEAAQFLEINNLLIKKIATKKNQIKVPIQGGAFTFFHSLSCKP
jgi:hypothetical protein